MTETFRDIFREHGVVIHPRTRTVHIRTWETPRPLCYSTAQRSLSTRYLVAGPAEAYALVKERQATLCMRCFPPEAADLIAWVKEEE